MNKKCLKNLSIAILATVGLATAVCVGIALNYKVTHKDSEDYGLF